MSKAEKKADLAVVDGGAKDVVRLQGASLFFDVAKFEHAQRVATLFAHSTMVPGHFKGNIGNCVIALNCAERMRLDPFMLMQNMYVVHGRPGIEAKLAIALINGCGRFEPLEYEHGSDDRGQFCLAFTKDIKAGKVLKGPRVDWKMVVDEGWNKDGKNKTTGEIIKSKWNTMRDLMFEYRAAMFFARTRCPEVLLGLQTTEEILDFVEMEPGTNGAYTVKEKTKEKLGGLKKRLGDDTKKPAESTEKEFETLTSVPLATFGGLRTKGIKQFVRNYNDKIVNKEWPEHILAIVRKKLATQPEWEKLLVYPPAEPTTEKPSETEQGEDPVRVALDALTKPEHWVNLGLVECPNMDGNNAPAVKCQYDSEGELKPCPSKIDTEGVICPGLAAKLAKGEVLS